MNTTTMNETNAPQSSKPAKVNYEASNLQNTVESSTSILGYIHAWKAPW